MFIRLNRFIRSFTSYVNNRQSISIKVIENGWFLNAMGGFSIFLMFITLGTVVDNIITSRRMYELVKQRNFEIENDVFQKEREKRMSEMSNIKIENEK